jgi:hypothetical protein
MPNDNDGRQPNERASPQVYRYWRLSLDELAIWCKIELPCFKGLEVAPATEAGRPLH